MHTFIVPCIPELSGEETGEGMKCIRGENISSNGCRNLQETAGEEIKVIGTKRGVSITNQ